MSTQEKVGVERFGTGIRPSTHCGQPAELASSPPGKPQDSNTEALSRTKKKVQWCEFEDQSWTAIGSTIPRLPSAFYKVIMRNGLVFFDRSELLTDELIKFPNSIADKVLQEIDQFWTAEASFTKYNFLQRRGYMFYGDAGGGKTSVVHLIIQDIIKRGGVVFNCESPCSLHAGLIDFRAVEPNRKVVCLFEDIDAIVEQFSESELLSLLDGEGQITKVVNVATTNYPERLDPRLVARPRRFDRLIEVPMPDETTRALYFQKKLQIDKVEVAKWATATDGFSFGALTDLVISVKCLGCPFDEALERLKELITTRKRSGDFSRPKAGFSNGLEPLPWTG